MTDCHDELWLGGILLNGPQSGFTGNDYGFKVSRDGLEFEAASAAVDVVESLWADGDVETVRRHGNVTSTIFVQVRAGSLLGLAEGAAALRRAFPASGHTVDMVFRPSFDAPAAVRTVVRVEMSPHRVENDHYLQHTLFWKHFRLEVRHTPFVQSEFETVVDALPVSGGAQVIAVSPADMSGFSASSGTVTTDPMLGAEAPTAADLIWSGTHATGARDWLLVVGRVGAVVVTLDGVDYTLSPTVIDGDIKGYHLPRAGTITRLVWPGDAGVKRRVTLVATRDFPPIVTTPRQGYRVIRVGGTERTEGVLHVAARNGTTPLGTVLVFTSPVECPGFNPDLMPGLVSENPSAPDGPEGVSPGGGWVQVQTLGATSVRPVSSLCAGSYVVYAWMRSTATQVLTLTGRSATILPDSGQDPATHEFKTTVGFTANVPRMVPLGTVTWPPVDAGSGNAGMLLDPMLAASGTVALGGWWAFPVSADSSLTVASTTYPHLWVRSGSRVAGPRVRVNSVADEESGFTPGSSAVAAGPELTYPAGEALTYVVTTGASDASVDYRYRKQWVDNPPDDGSTP